MRILLSLEMYCVRFQLTVTKTKIISQTRMRRMRTVCCSGRLGWGGGVYLVGVVCLGWGVVWREGDVCQGEYLHRGVSTQRGVSAGRVSAQGRCLPRGVVSAQGVVSVQGGVVSAKQGDLLVESR